MPKWDQLFTAWNIPVQHVNRGFEGSDDFLSAFTSDHMCAFIVDIDPGQTYLPKISSRVTESGSMESNPIDKMSPEINYLESLK